jgi:hypothetical protein
MKTKKIVARLPGERELVATYTRLKIFVTRPTKFDENSYLAELIELYADIYKVNFHSLRGIIHDLNIFHFSFLRGTNLWIQGVNL